jgi:hypothetical protein
MLLLQRTTVQNRPKRELKMITKNTIQRSIAALAMAGTLAGVATTGAQAATAAGHAATGTARAASSQIAPQPQYSKRFNLVNQLGYATMKLTSAWGDNEGLPEIGTTMRPLESQGFEVQYKFGGTGFVYATYDIINPWGEWMGNVTVRMSYGALGETSTTIWGSDRVSVTITNAGDGPAVTWK